MSDENKTITFAMSETILIGIAAIAFALIVKDCNASQLRINEMHEAKKLDAKP